MRTIPWVLVILAWATVWAAVAASTDAIIETGIIIRTYQSGLVGTEILPSALSVTAGILKAAALDVRWRLCDEGHGRKASDPCEEPLGTNELTIRFLRQPLRPDQAGQVVLGTSLIDTQAGSGTFATIYVDRVDGLARDSRIRGDIVLGRAIAHEIGHLLLGTSRHARTGLMRAVWSTETLRHDEAGDWLFTASEARSMREARRPQPAR
jgi:hypothetical protein